MRTLCALVAVIGLALTVVPALLVFLGRLAWEQHAWAMLLGTIFWFACAPVWMSGRRAP